MSDRALTTRLRTLAGARIALGVVVLVRTTPAAAWLGLPIDAPRVLVDWPGAAWAVHAGASMPAGLVAVLCILRTAGAAAFLFGLWTRGSALVAAVAGVALLTQDVFVATHTFRLLYGSLFVLAFTDCGAAWAVRVLPARDLRSSEWLVRCWALSVYAWAVVAKLRPGWWTGRALLLDASDGLFRPWVVRAFLSSAHACATTAILVLALEALIAGLLVSRHTHRAAVALALAMHVAFELVATPDVFGAVMIALLGVVWTSTEQAPDRGRLSMGEVRA